VSEKLRDWLQSNMSFVVNVFLYIYYYKVIENHSREIFFSFTSARRPSLSDFPAFNLKTWNIGYKASKAIRINDLAL
jgi:hypothetical protein